MGSGLGLSLSLRRWRRCWARYLLVRHRLGNLILLNRLLLLVLLSLSLSLSLRRHKSTLLGPYGLSLRRWRRCWARYLMVRHKLGDLVLLRRLLLMVLLSLSLRRHKRSLLGLQKLLRLRRLSRRVEHLRVL